jgi:capsular polysaccharide biosynthesis protein
MFPKSINSIGTCEEAIFLGGTNNLMHFAIEEIPKLYKLYLLNLPSDIPIILRADLSMQIREMLHILSERPLIFLKSFEEISVDRLHLFQLDNVLPLSMQGVEEVDHLLFDPISLQWASKKFRSLAPKSSGFHRIQIIREPRLFRQLINVKKISERLSTDFLFENLLTGNLSLEQAIYFFQDAKIIIGEYGAGLANLLFVSSSCKVIELKGPSNEKCREYYLLSKALGLEYFSIVGKARLLSKYGIGNGQFKINLSELLKILKYVLSKELQ